MRRNRNAAVSPPDVLLTMRFERSTVDSLDMAARFLGVSRQEVLLRGFVLLTKAADVVLGHSEHQPGCLDNLLIS